MIRKMSRVPLTISTVAAGSPKEIWIASPPTIMPAKNRPDTMANKGFNLASQATMMAVNPYPDDTEAGYPR